MSFVAVGVTAGVGITQAVLGGIKAHKAQEGLQNLKTPTYSPNQAISSYYQQALQKYNTSPYQSNFYEQAQKAAGRNEATAIGATMDRHSAGNIGAIVQGTDDQMQKAGVQAEGLQRQAFGQLGTATNMENADYQRQFDQNQLAPYEKQASIYQGKAIAGSQMENAGFQNLSGGIGAYSQMNQLKALYGGGNKGAGAQGGQLGGSKSSVNGVPQFSGNNTAWANTGGLGYQPGSNTDVVMNSNAYSNLGFPQ